jgi:hypothetical protein
VETDSWSAGRSGPTVVVFGAAGATTGVNALKRVYVLGLVRGSSCTNQVYDAEADAWATAAAMPTDRINFGVAVVDDVLYAIGGYYHNSRSYVLPSKVNEQYIPIGYGVPPEITVLSPINQLYNESSVSLVFTVDKPVNWMGYSFDGDENVTVTGNLTLTGLSVGVHNVTIYAKDEFGNTGASEIVVFSVASEPFPVIPVAVASVSVVAVTAAGLLVYRRKRRREAAQA